MLACSTWSWIYFGFSPPSISIEAKKWRRSWNLFTLSSVAFLINGNAIHLVKYRGSMKVPLRVKINWSSEHPPDSVRIISKACMTIGGMPTLRNLPLFVGPIVQVHLWTPSSTLVLTMARSILISRLIQSISPHCRARISPRRNPVTASKRKIAWYSTGAFLRIASTSFLSGGSIFVSVFRNACIFRRVFQACDVAASQDSARKSPASRHW